LRRSSPPESVGEVAGDKMEKYAGTLTLAFVCSIAAVIVGQAPAPNPPATG